MRQTWKIWLERAAVDLKSHTTKLRSAPSLATKSHDDNNSFGDKKHTSSTCVEVSLVWLHQLKNFRNKNKSNLSHFVLKLEAVDSFLRGSSVKTKNHVVRADHKQMLLVGVVFDTSQMVLVFMVHLQLTCLAVS